jgi:predicted AAA+ superfamily ATPase
MLNASELGKSLDITHHTVKKYIDILSGTFMVRHLQPWFENISKRQVKSPKLYIRDSGILHTLLSIHTNDMLQTHPKLGASWEGFALEQIIDFYHMQTEECYFWATQSGAELDLFFIKDGKRLGFEFKYTDHPKITKSMHTALEDLKLDHLYLVYPHDQTFTMTERITALGLKSF